MWMLIKQLSARKRSNLCWVRYFDKFIKTAKVLTLLKSNSILISNRDIAHETLPTSRFEIEIEFDFKKTKCQPNG